MFALDKIATPFISPLGAAIVLGLLALLLFIGGRRRLGPFVLLLAVAGLCLMATPFVAHHLAGMFEHRFPPQATAATPSADVIIVLGGATAPALPPRQDVELNEHADRIMHAADLYKAGKARVIIASGGNWHYASAGVSEAASIRDILMRFGVPNEAIVLEGGSDDTAGNARLSEELMRQHGWTTALLVTSALHMPRALASFIKAGVAATPSSTDIIDAPSPDWPVLDWLPDVEALGFTTAALHEWLGDIYYRLRGWT